LTEDFILVSWYSTG